MQGKICHYNEERGFGFVRPDDNSGDLFFHISWFDDATIVPQIGAATTFDKTNRDGRTQAHNIKLLAGQRNRRTEFTPDYDGTFVDLSTEAIDACLNEIANWKLEAKLEDLVKYFCPVPELDAIISGKKSYVIGRKGTGKTAIVEYLNELKNAEDGFFTYKLTFKNFPFNELYDLKNDAYTRPNQYISIWKYIIYSYVVRAMQYAPSVDPLIKRQISKIYPDPNSSSLRNLLSKWTSGDFSISILGTGFSFANWFRKKERTSWQQRVNHLEEFIAAQADGSSFMILFDELDEDYKEMLERYPRSEYIDLLTSLFKAVQDVRSVMDKAGKRIFPVIFLRDDIFDLIQDADKNKWRDLTAHLDWNLQEIRILLKHRLSKSANIDATNFDEIWYSIFDSKSVPYAGGRKSLHSFDYITRSTQGRPRDFIHYLQVCAENQLSSGGSRILATTVRDADKSYSNYLKSELVDEIHGLIPDIQEILRLFTQIRKWIISIDEFKDAYKKSFDGGIISTKDPDFVLQTLFYFSVIGNEARQRKFHVFRHDNPDAVLNLNENIVIHRGLMKALQIF